MKQERFVGTMFGSVPDALSLECAFCVIINYVCPFDYGCTFVVLHSCMMHLPGSPKGLKVLISWGILLMVDTAVGKMTEEGRTRK